MLQWTVMKWIKGSPISCFILLHLDHHRDLWKAPAASSFDSIKGTWLPYLQTHGAAPWIIPFIHRDFLYPSHKHLTAAFFLWNEFFLLCGSGSFYHIALKMPFFHRVITLSEQHKKPRSQDAFSIFRFVLFCFLCRCLVTNLIYLTCMVFSCSSCSIFLWLHEYQLA